MRSVSDFVREGASTSSQAALLNSIPNQRWALGRSNGGADMLSAPFSFPGLCYHCSCYPKMPLGATQETREKVCWRCRSMDWRAGNWLKWNNQQSAGVSKSAPDLEN